MELRQVLVVEDEDLIRMMIDHTMVEAGFDVCVAATGAEAIAYIEEASDAPAGLVTDVKLNDVSGWSVAKHAREKFPQIAVVYVTGEAGNDWPSNGVPGSVCIQKPFAPAQIVTALANQLNAVPPESS